MWVTIYCDASYKEGKKAGAYWIKSDHKRLVEAVPLEVPHGDNNLAEVEIAAIAIKRAIDAHIDDSITGILLVSDNMLTVNVLRYGAPAANNKPIRAIQEKVCLMLQLKKIRIRTKHQKGHMKGKGTGIYVNNRVDKLAKAHRERPADF